MCVHCPALYVCVIVYDERQRRLADRVARRMLRERAPSPHGDSDSDEDPYAWGSPEPVLGHVPGYARRH